MKENSELSQSLQCGECPLKFESQDGLEKHHVDTHVFPSVFSFIESSNEEHEECDGDGVALKLQSQNFQCGECHFSSDTELNLRNHIIDNVHRNVLRFSCNVCDFKSFYKNYVKRHVLKVHNIEKDTKNFINKIGGEDDGVIRFKCNLCDYKSYYKRYVKKHQACSHDGEKQEIIDINRSNTDTSQRENPIDPRFGCNLCDKKSRKSVTIRKHQAKFHPDDNFKVVKIGDKKEKKREIVKIEEKKEKKEKIQCSICSMEFESQRQTILHYKQEHPQDKLFKCRTCNFGSNSSQNLKFHEERHKEGAKSVDIKVNPCFVCNVECETKNKRLEHYRREHPTERIFKCRICDYGSNKISSFKVHEKRHGREKKLKLDEECHLCKKKFQYFIEKQAHYRSEHPTEKIFSCEFCDFGSNRKGNFKHHMEHIHVDGMKSVSKKIVRVKLNGAQLNNCKVCEEKFQSRRKLVAHFRKEHPDETLFKCESCDYSSNYLANIKTHSESTHTQELRKCEVCEFSTRWNTTFLQHMRDKHQVIQRPRKCVTVTESMICHECGFEAKTKEQQRRHTHSLYKCYECEATFHTKSGRFLHRKTKHQKVTFSCDKG